VIEGKQLVGRKTLKKSLIGGQSPKPEETNMPLQASASVATSAGTVKVMLPYRQKKKK